jgi:thiamine pyrophosphokinase
MLAVLVADGEPATEDQAHLAAADLAVAVDGGARWLEANGRNPDVLVGDFDSLEPAAVRRLRRAGTRVVRYPADKDASDTELALVEALAAGATRVVMLGALRGIRLDHELANIGLLFDPRFEGRDIRIVRGPVTIRGLAGGGRLTLESPPGGTVTLLPVGGDAIGVTTRGLRYPLKAEALRMGSSRGLSNEVTDRPARVRLEIGSLVVIETRDKKGNEK